MLRKKITQPVFLVHAEIKILAKLQNTLPPIALRVIQYE